jgi:hypothetical protein
MNIEERSADIALDVAIAGLFAPGKSRTAAVVLAS